MNMFTKQHYQAIAEALASTACPTCHNELTIAALAKLFLRDNPAFDQQRFLIACGIPEERVTHFVADYLLDRGQEPIVGWIAFWRGKRCEIQRNDKTDSLWQAKQVALAELGVPKSEHGMLAIVPATAAEREDPGHGREG